MKQIFIILVFVPHLIFSQSTALTILGQHTSTKQHSSKLMLLELNQKTDEREWNDQSIPANELLIELKKYLVKEGIDTNLIKRPYQIGNPMRSYTVKVTTDGTFNKMVKICDSLNISIRKIEYQFDTRTEEELGAMAIKAVQNAKKKAMAIAEALNLELIQIINIDDQISEYDPEAEEVLLEMIEAGFAFEGIQVLDDSAFVFSDELSDSTMERATYRILVTFELRPKQKKE